MNILDRKNLRIVIVFLVGVVAAFLLPFLFTYCYAFSADFDAGIYDNALISLGKESAATNDIPVAALLIYKGKIIGKGCNDVLKNWNPSGHAEINAIADCFKKVGYSRFKSLHKDHLFLLTTYEPCTMCKGAIQEYGIKKVVFSFAKRKIDKISNIKNDLKYYYYLQQMKNKRLQYDLFKMHPDFDTIQYPY